MCNALWQKECDTQFLFFLFFVEFYGKQIAGQIEIEKGAEFGRMNDERFWGKGEKADSK